jgi:hypothetical protein
MLYFKNITGVVNKINGWRCKKYAITSNNPIIDISEG